MGSRLALVEEQREAIHAIGRRHKARALAVFGSVARGEDTEASDIDFLVDFEQGATLLDVLALQDDLEALLRCPVDVVSRGGLKERDDHIRREAVAV